MTEDDQSIPDNPATTPWPKRVAWRKVLPIVQVALAIALSAAAYEHNRLIDAEVAEWNAQPHTLAEGEAVFFDPRRFTHCVEPAMAVLFSMDLPALLIAFPAELFALLLEHFGYKGERVFDFALTAPVLYSAKNPRPALQKWLHDYEAGALQKQSATSRFSTSLPISLRAVS